MIRGQVLAAAGCVFALLASSAAHGAEDNIPASIAAQRIPIERSAGGGFTGRGWRQLVDDARQAQFMLVGEQHGSGSIAQFETDLQGELAERGYTHSAYEVGPYSMRFAERLIRSGKGRLKAYIGAPGHGFTIPFLFFGEEVALAEQMVANSPDRTHAIWGLDQEFVGAGPIQAQLLNEYARTASERSAAAAFAAGSSSDEFFAGKLKSADIAKLRVSFAGNPQALQLIDAIDESAAIYRPYMDGGGDYYTANLARESLMKRQFVTAFDEAERRRKLPPKVFFKFGANHMMRGFGDTNVSTLGNFITEWATSRRWRALNLFIECDGGEAANPKSNKTEACEPYFEKDALMRQVVAAGPPLQLYDLRPLRGKLGGWKSLDAATRKLILAFDYYAVIRGGRAATTIGSLPATTR